MEKSHISVFLILFSTGHLAIIETDDEKNALQGLIDAAPKWAHPRDIFLGASTG